MKRVLKNWYWIIIIGFIICSSGIFLILGEKSIIAIHDNLDLFTPQYQMMKDTHTFFSVNANMPFLHGIDRLYLPSEFNIYTFLYILLPAYYAYIAGYVLKIIIAMVSAALLAKDILKNEFETYKGYVYLIGFAYGILNLFPNFAICFSSIPLLIFIMRKIINSKKKVWLWFIILFMYPLLSYFSYFGIFILGYMALYFIYACIKGKRFAKRELFSVIVLAMGYICFEYRLFATMLFSDVESIRQSMVIGSLDLKGVLLTIWEGIAVGDMHSESLQLKFVLPVCATLGIVQLYIYIKEKNIKNVLHDPYFGILLFIIFNGFVYGIYYCEAVRNLFDTLIPPLAGFQFSRTGFFNPFLWYVELFIVVKRIYDYGKEKRFVNIVSYIIIMITIFVTVFTGTRYNDFYHTCVNEYHLIRSGEKNRDLSFQEFYSENLFKKALEDINYKGEWSAAYGLYPAVLQYNGVSTLDGYLGYYSNEYKAEFRKIIAPSLEKIPESAAYYDNWGARCGLYSGTYTSNIFASRDYSIESEDIFIDTEQFKNMDGKYIFAAMEIINAQDMNLKLAGRYEDIDSPYTLFVYSAAD